MKNCLVMGFGRSGTSLMGGILHQAGYFMGDDLYPPRHSNPKGFYENAVINGINERIMAAYDHPGNEHRAITNGKYWSPYRPSFGHRWLSYISTEVDIDQIGEPVKEEMMEVLKRKPFAYKDPRFNYTLSAWRPMLGDDTMLICLFREPWVTVQSVLEECRSADYLSDFYIDPELADRLWCQSYQHLLKNTSKFEPSRVIYVHYKQVISGAILPLLSELLGVTLSGQFADKSLDRTRSEISGSEISLELYSSLCRMARFNDFA